MSSRFHNKWHRHNHHTNVSLDPRYPDSAHDPIASPESPFQGIFVLAGPLSAYNSDINDFTGYFASPNIALVLDSPNIALQATGNTSIVGDISALDIYGSDFYLRDSFTNNVIYGYQPSSDYRNIVNTTNNTVIGFTNSVLGGGGYTSILGSQILFYNTTKAVAVGNSILAGESTSLTDQQNSIGIGNNINLQGSRSVGIGAYITANADDSMVIGTGYSLAEPLVNNQAESLGIGFNTTTPAVIICNTGLGINLSGNVLPDKELHVRGDALIDGELRVTGNFTVDGNLSYLDTQIIATSSVEITNYGTETGLTVKQYGQQPVAHFYDDNNSALFIDGSNTAPGYVGINTTNPNHRLTVVGSISATDGLLTNNITVGTANISLSTVRTFTNPLTSTGDFLVLTINGQPKAIRLWNY